MQDAPYFAEGVYDRARATQARLAKANFDKINEPKVFARAIKEVYATHPLITIIEKNFAELSKSRNYDVVYTFNGPRLTLSKDGFRMVGGRDIAASIPLGDCADALAARRKVDEQLAQLAEDPEGLLTNQRGPAKAPEKAPEQEQQAQQEQQAAYPIKRNRHKVRRFLGNMFGGPRSRWRR